MHGTVLLGNTGALLAPAVIWPDQRSARQVAEITAAFGRERLFAVTGSPLSTGFLAATVRWFQQERPELWAQVRQILLPKDYLRWRLTGEYATDPSDGAGSLLFDEARRDWSTALLDTLDIARSQLPPVQSSSKVAGTLTATAARELGLAPGVPVVTGAADTACGMLGAGATDRSRLLLSISTGGQVALPSAQMAPDPQGRVHTFCSALDPGQPGQAGWYQMGATLSAGMALRWLRDCVLGWTQPDAYAAMTALAAQAAPGSQGLLFLPYLVGERTPHMDPAARGAFWGLTLRHGQAELVRAVLEGVTFACYDAFAVLETLGGAPA
jgi:xylulokinase